MGSGSMKVHQFAGGLISWDQQHEPSLTLGLCKRLRPRIPKNNPTTNSDITNTNTVTTTSTSTTPIPFDLKSFIKPNSGPRKSDVSSSDLDKRDESTLVETHPGGTRWNPTQEQIGILEMLYMGGMRTPNAQQIEQITQQLGKYGKIEGKNVFYWFQNHKARERQKQRRSNLGLRTHTHRSSSASFSTITLSTRDVQELEERSLFKKKCRAWSFESLEEEEQKNKTLELFPLHPELHRKMN